MELRIRRKLGQILVDAGLLKKHTLDRACEEQQRTHELLGQVLVRMGVLKAHHVKAPLLIQDHLSSIDDAVKVAAGERQLLGVLLVQSGKITRRQLDEAVAEQKRSGDRLGKVFTRLGMLTERQLAALLEFQHHQDDTTAVTPLRLGELLVATGHISREQLNAALLKQDVSHKKIGEILVEEGYITPRRLKSAFCLQKMLINSVLAALLSLGTGAAAMAETVSLQWAPNTDANLAGYKVYYTADASPLASAAPLNVGLQTTATITGLDPGHSYQFAVTAYDTAGNESTFSNIVTVAEQAPPTVGITSPLNATTVRGVVTVSVSASDNVGITKVEFYVNGILTATDTATPYTYSWDTTTLAAGAYTLTVKAYDAAGNVGQASSTVTVRPHPPAKIGVFNDAYWYLDTNRNWAWDGVPTDTLGIFGLGIAGAIPVAGDWNNDGTSEIGLFVDGVWYLDTNGNGQWDGEGTDTRYTFGAGIPNARPVVGDWTGDGTTKIGIYADGVWYLDMNGNGQWDGEGADTRYTFGAGIPNARPVVGDWTGDGKTKIGIYADGVWYLDMNGNGQWDGEGIDVLGRFGAGLPNALPVTGDWNGDGITKIGVYSNGSWYLDANRNWVWDGAPTDTYGAFGLGLPHAMPVTGNW